MTEGKYAKSAVRYGVGGDHCEVCKYFYDENESTEIGLCRKVEGSIGGNMWCKLFARVDSKVGTSK
jgi:hypothetical protein